MGRLSLAIGRHKEGSDGRTKPRHLRTSIRGLLGIPGSERASVDLGEVGDLADERISTPRCNPGTSKLSKEENSCSTATTAVNTGDLSAAIMPQNASEAVVGDAALLSSSTSVPEDADYRLFSTPLASKTQPPSVPAAAPSNLANITHSSTEAPNDDVVNAQEANASAQTQNKQSPPTTDASTSMHAHADAEVVPISRFPYTAGSATAEQAAAMERYSIGTGNDVALQGRTSKDDDKNGWRRRGSLISSRLAMPSRKDSGAGGNGNGNGNGNGRTLIRKESTPLFGSGKNHHFWRSGGAHRNSMNAHDERPLPPPPPPPKHVEVIARQERTHRSSSVPFITPILSAKDSSGSLFSNDGSSASRGLASGPSSRMPMASPYLRAVSSGLTRSTTGGNSSAGAIGRLNQNHHSKSIIASRHAQDRLPRIMLSGGFDGSGSRGPPSPLALSVPSDKKTAATAPMTFLVSPRPRAGSGTKRGSAAPLHTLNKSSTSSREFNLCKRTLSSTTIPSLDLNSPSSPKALSGGVDLSEFGVSTEYTETRSNLPLPPSPVSAGTPARSIASASAGATFEPLHESAAEDEGNSNSQAASGIVSAADNGAARESPNHNAFSQPAQGSSSNGGDSGSTDAVHETHHMEVQHDPRTGRKMINQYMIIRELGRGTHGKVKLAFDTITGEYYAIKVIDKESQDRRLRPNAHSHNAKRARDAAAAAAAQGSGHRRSRGYLRIDFDKMEKVKREIAILKKCRHPNVVRLREVIDDAHARRIYLVIEYMDQGEIVWRDSSRLPAMSQGEARSVFRDLVLGVEYLHYVGILHRDLKPQNLLRNKAGTVKISDFGVSFLSRRMSKRHLKEDEKADSSVSADDTPASLPPKPSQQAHDTASSIHSSAHTHAMPPSPLRPAGMRPAKQLSSLHRYASQPVMKSSSSSKLASGPVLHRKASVLSSSSKNLLTSSSGNSRESDKNVSISGSEGLKQPSSGLQQLSDRASVPVTQLKKLCIHNPSDVADDKGQRQSQGKQQNQRPFSQSIQWPATMGMTNEFGHRKASLPLPVRPATDHHQRQLSNDSDSSQMCKLPVEILSADSNVYDPFDSSDSAEFFSSENSDSDSDYGGSNYPQKGYAEDGNSSLDDNSEDGIVFGASTVRQDASSSNNNSPTTELPTIELPAESIGRSSRHGRKGTLGEIDFAYDEKDEERELAKTAGTPAFFAPELCCTTEELAKVLREERVKRQTCSKSAPRHRYNTDPLGAATLSHAATPGQHSIENEQISGHKEAGGSNRPTSLYVESSTTASGHGLGGASILGNDTQRVPSNPRSMKRHSMLTSLLARPFSARSRSSANNNSSGSNRSSANEGQLGDVQAALDSLEKAAVNAGSSSPGSGLDEVYDIEQSSGHGVDDELPSNVITHAIDIWAMGVTLYCLIYGRVPFQASTEFELFSIIPHQQVEFPEYLEVGDEEECSGFGGMLFNPSSKHGDSDTADAGSLPREPSKRHVKLPPLDPDLCDLLRRLLDKDFRTRITIEEIKHHPWVVRDLDRPSSWAKETDPTHRPSFVITSQEVEQAMVPKVRQSRGFRASVKRRISMLSPLAGSRRHRASQQQQRQQMQRVKGDGQMSAKTKSSLDWLKIW
ncbi:hypothetical protein IW140_000765 [Coemansia sp. RSA 1813]|nr:hypothetical protein EV178_000729 [Coemansia sp. RSA 1646]KAJ1773635.1 hypothetical protein LPJ74_000551 [Coemansia sp. RSA 1843]KAJ2092349.1 hypothetical protein IW138_001111 [Coemansia sp. RSA 986]KAJ2217424.1 hypothetical protein EV179_000574 [Coemansia sp. RSA 487]KAJ2572650.1 hypothetical protein IW140_000765 [Coemansia sp. RSA 1813]